MGILDIFRKAREPNPEATNPIEEKLQNQTDEDRLDEQKARLAALPEEEQKAWVPEGDVKEQGAVDEEQRPSN